MGRRGGGVMQKWIGLDDFDQMSIKKEGLEGGGRKAEKSGGGGGKDIFFKLR